MPKYVLLQINYLPPMENPEPNIDDLIIALPLHEKVPVVALKKLLDQRTILDDEQQLELEKIRMKYHQKMKPLLQRASQLIQGKDPKAQEIVDLKQYLKNGEKPGQLKGKILDRYWNAALQNSQIANFITEKDEKALEYLLDVQVVDSDNKEVNSSSINLRFVFKPNSYFSETSVVRRLKYSNGQPVCLQGDLLSWKQGNWLTYESKKVNNKATGESKVVQGKKIDSFFDIFLNWTAVENPNEIQKSDAILSELLVVIRDSLSYFLGLFDYDVLSDEDDDSDDDEDDEEEQPNRRKK